MNTRRFLFYIACVAACMAVACTAPAVKHFYTLGSGYANANLSDRKIVVVMPSDRHLIINNPKDVINDYGGANARPESRIRKFYYPAFLQSFKSLASGDSVFDLAAYRPDVAWDSLSTRTVTLATGVSDSAIRYSVPPKAAMQAAGLDGAVAVIIETLEFTRNNFYIEYYWDDKTRRDANLEADATVLIWDFKADAPVFYGRVSYQAEFRFGMSRSQWDESAQSLAKRLVFAAKCL